MFRKITLMLFVAAMLTGCGKKWKKATPVAMDFQTVGFDQAGAVVEGLDFTTGHAKVTNMQVLGARKQSDDIDLEQSNSANINFNAENGTNAFNFDIPQGTYTDLNLLMTVGNNNNDPSIMLDGTYTDPNGDVVVVQFDLRLQDVIRVQVKDSDNSNEVVLVADEKKTLNITLDFNYWFSSITPLMWYEADHVGVSSNSPIKIDENNNQSIYEVVKDRIPEGITAKFE